MKVRVSKTVEVSKEDLTTIRDAQGFKTRVEARKHIRSHIKPMIEAAVDDLVSQSQKDLKAQEKKESKSAKK